MDLGLGSLLPAALPHWPRTWSSSEHWASQETVDAQCLAARTQLRPPRDMGGHRGHHHQNYHLGPFCASPQLPNLFSPISEWRYLCLF